MTLTLHELTTDSEFPPIVAVEHEAFATPFNGFWEILKGPSQEECCARQLAWHKADPSSHWIYVKDGEEVIAAMQWNIHRENIYAGGVVPMMEGYWWGEGILKEVSDQILYEFFSARPYLMNKPHFLISYCFVSPFHRRRGAASLMMEWGKRKADEMGLEIFVESTEDGRAMYEAHGFQVVKNFFLDADVEKEPCEEFQRLRDELGCPIHGFYMWRRVGGRRDGRKGR